MQAIRAPELCGIALRVPLKIHSCSEVPLQYLGIKGITDYSVCTNHADRLSSGDMYEQPYGANQSGIPYFNFNQVNQAKGGFSE